MNSKSCYRINIYTGEIRLLDGLNTSNCDWAVLLDEEWEQFCKTHRDEIEEPNYED